MIKTRISPIVHAACIVLALSARVLAADLPVEAEVDVIRSIETKRLRALQDADLDAAKAFHADDYQLITPSGSPMTRDEYLGAVASGILDYIVFEAVSPIAVRLYRDAAVIRYETHIESAWNGVRGRGGRFWHTDVYEKRDGRWQVVWSQATPVWQSSSPKEAPKKPVEPPPGA